MGFLDFLKRDPRKKPCTRCGRPAAHGYSQAAESELKQITPFCLSCLTEQLQRDYGEFTGHALVVSPATGLPCYVFRNVEYLKSFRAGWKHDLEAILQNMDECAECKSEAHCLWMTARGLTVDTFADVLEKAIQQTLIAWGNPDPIALCGKCTARRITEALQGNGVSFFEICSPHGSQKGIVLPMAY